ncbi:hypothetical protein F2Q70_00022443 [Brassica cretica]|uniref:Uncharacterized protein n=1 Tax=Brassica cretica TaxID=69181 RepID=A0A8S9GRU1_BRACR|nr:hypothetical protein F2Q70_00022443 [Brassica cretica]
MVNYNMEPTGDEANDSNEELKKSIRRQGKCNRVEGIDEEGVEGTWTMCKNTRRFHYTQNMLESSKQHIDETTCRSFSFSEGSIEYRPCLDNFDQLELTGDEANDSDEELKKSIRRQGKCNRVEGKEEEGVEVVAKSIAKPFVKFLTYLAQPNGLQLNEYQKL